MVVVLTVIQGFDQELELSEALRESMDTLVNTSSVCGSKSLVEALEKVKVEDLKHYALYVWKII